MTPLCSRTGLVGPVPKRRWRLSWTNHCYGRNLSSLIYAPKLKNQSNEWKHPGSPRPKKVRPTQCAVKVVFIVVYDIDGVILHHALPQRQMVNVVYYCTFLQQHLRPRSGENYDSWWYGTPSFFMTMQGVTPLRRHGSLAPLAMGYSVISTVLTRYDPFAKVKGPLLGIRNNTREELIRAIGRSIWNINKMDALMVYDAF